MKILAFIMGLTAIFLVKLPSTVLGQEREINFIVLDDKEQPLPYANVVEIGSESNGTITDLQGKAKLFINKKSRFISISFIGFKSVRLEVELLKTNDPITIIMEVDEILLNELEIIDIGIDPNQFIEETLEIFLNASRKKNGYSEIRYQEKIVENGEIALELMAELYQESGLPIKEKKQFQGKESDSYFLKQLLLTKGEPKFRLENEIITNRVYKALGNFQSSEFFENPLVLSRYQTTKLELTKQLNSQPFLRDLDWAITKMQKNGDETLVLFETRVPEQKLIPYFREIQLLIDLNTKQIISSTFSMNYELSKYEMKEVPEFANKEEYMEWAKYGSLAQYNNTRRMYIGVGKMHITYFYNDEIPYEQNILLNAKYANEAIDGPFEIELQARSDLKQIKINSRVDESVYPEVNTYTNKHTWWKKNNSF